MRIVGYHITDSLIANSDGECCTETPFLEFLLAEKKDTIKVFYHLNQSVAYLCKLIGMTPEQIRKLNKLGQYYLPPYIIKYIPAKQFSITHGTERYGAYANFSDITQYTKSSLEPLQDKKYALNKALEASIIGEMVYNAMFSAGLHPTTLSSPIRVFQKEELETRDLPTIDDIPEKAAEYAYACCHGGWLEAFKKGYFNTLYDFDLSSAYSYFCTQQMDTRLGKWTCSKEYQDSYYGFCRAEVDIDAWLSPILYVKNNEQMFTPNGTWETYLTKREIDFINKYRLGEVRIIDGWWWTPEKIETPLKQMILELDEKKNKADEFDRGIIKRIMNGLWGKFSETFRDNSTFGANFNPVWAADVETANRLEVARFCYENNITPLHIAVDGIVTDAPVELPEGNGMGKWRLNSTSPGFVISSGVVCLRDKKGQNDFSLDYEWLKEQIERYPKQSCYEMKKLSPITIAKACSQNKIDRLGELEEITKTVDVEYEAKRCYREIPKNGRELMSREYGSEPWDVSMLEIED